MLLFLKSFNLFSFSRYRLITLALLLGLLSLQADAPASAWRLPFFKKHQATATLKSSKDNTPPLKIYNTANAAHILSNAPNPQPALSRPPTPEQEAPPTPKDASMALASAETVYNQLSIESPAPEAFKIKTSHFRTAFHHNQATIPSQDIEPIARFIQGYNKKLPNNDVSTFAGAITYFSQFYRVNPKLIASVIAVESSFRSDAISSSGAIGLGQLKPDTATWLGVGDPYDPIENIGGMTRYLSWLIQRYNGSYDHAVSAYFQGQGTIDRNGITEACVPYLYRVNDVLSRF